MTKSKVYLKEKLVNQNLVHFKHEEGFLGTMTVHSTPQYPL